MSTTQKNRANSPFSEPTPANSLRLRLLMEEQQRVEIGERVKSLRENSSETNRSIADYCDVGERTVAGWVAGAGISYKNAKKVSELFEVEIDWLWRGREQGPAPDVTQRLADLEGIVGELVDELRADRAVQIAKAAGQDKQRSRRQRQAGRPAKPKKAEGG